MYHAIGDLNSREEGAYLYCVSRENFMLQMDWLSRNKKDTLITFDDGDISNFDIAYPVLKELNLKAFFFVSASLVGKPGYMNWNQLLILKEAGMIIGSHGMTHTILTRLNKVQLHDEIIGSKKIIVDRIGNPVDYFSIAKGHYTLHVIEALRKASYKAVFSSDVTGHDEFVKCRIAVRKNWDLNHFKYVIDHGLPLKECLIDKLKNTAKKCLGPNMYHTLRCKALRAKKGTV